MRKTFYQKNLYHFRIAMVMAAFCGSPFAVHAASHAIEQTTPKGQHKITGTVKDEQGSPLPGVHIKVQGSTLGTVTDINGQYSLNLPNDKSPLEFSFIGYISQVVSASGKSVLTVRLQPDTKKLDEVIVVGYGTQKKKDLTGSIANVSSKDFNKGLMSSPEQLINGKVAGVQIMSNSGSPTSGSTVRIRGGASLNASNDPLIVIDGVPLENGGISGNGNNFLSLINPNDIESISILKDASSTAIYGSRASNGVMMITTKKGVAGKFKVNASTTFSVQNKTRLPEMLSTEEFRNLINAKGSDAQKALLGNATTNWSDQVYQTAIGSDNNVSVTGGITKFLPFRASYGYYNQDGILKTDNLERMSGSMALNPSFFNGKLKLNLNLKGSINHNTFANTGAVWGAATFNPTQPVYSGNSTFGGYYETIDNTGIPVVRATLNPLGSLEQEQNKSTVKRAIGNFDVDYQLHFLPEMKAHVSLGYDVAKGEGTDYIPVEAAAAFKVGGTNNAYSQTKTNKLFSSYLNYNKEFKSLLSKVDVTAGYDYQDWLSKNPVYVAKNVAGDVLSTSPGDYQRHVLLSYYGRLNYTLNSKYLLTATVRRDGTSRFSTDTRWGTFPSLALAWQAKDESFLKNVDAISDLKVRVGYGVTGQQEGIGNYTYLPIYTLGNEYAQYRFGNTYYNTYRPSVYVSDLKWETTDSYNVGLDVGFLKNRITANVDYYTRKTKDLLATVSVAAGTNFGSQATTNVGNIESNGVEFALNVTPVQTKDLTWNVGFNATYQKVKITNLSLVKDATSPGTYTGPQVGGRGLQILTEGYTPYMFYVYKQVYDSKGKPIEGMYADLDKNGVINEKDLYRYHSPMPDYLLGFNTSLSYKKWTAACALRASIGNYVYNNMNANTGAWETLQYNAYALNNLAADYLNTGFNTRQFYSDYYVENASFLKMDNITLGYNVGKVMKNVNLRVSALVQNVFTITKYSGVDPEISNGFDSQFYPRPRTFSLNVNLDF